MKWLLLFFSVIKPFFSSEHPTINPVEEIKDLIRSNAVAVITLFAAASALATMFAGGLLLVAVDIGAQYDQNGFVYFSSMIIMGLALSLVSLIIGAVVVRSFQEPAREKKRETLTKETVGVVHPLQDALALLIMDFVKEREFNRTQDELHASERSRAQETATEDLRH
ncbi:hypothetical protein C0V70_13765 [Bacteriovorax stolpii]|uniref:Uncharacterized protein n=1 Tax=Bacteriovorax stolpii TaxID=960 RepID=A0A2K9NUF7_BACTC|nr:hypothetical protein [Bacteriovorax stolpii]AUN99149.1 hypothetical protein C0V70_13765 [Bacteriovorax stolpii]TDP55317.1 hypothetical protein C8D79_0364 [Bacteriovorax stolpii]